jgi:hypothetical protein
MGQDAGFRRADSERSNDRRKPLDLAQRIVGRRIAGAAAGAVAGTGARAAPPSAVIPRVGAAARPMWRAALIGAALGLAATGAQAGQASDIAERGAFLLGHAYRCGVKAEQLQPTAQLIHELSAAFASDDDDKNSADKLFAERFVVSAVADSTGQLLPSCAAVKRELAQLEQHDPEAVASGSSSPPGEARQPAAPATHAAVKHARAARVVRPAKAATHKLPPR